MSGVGRLRRGSSKSSAGSGGGTGSGRSLGLEPSTRTAGASGDVKCHRCNKAIRSERFLRVGEYTFHMDHFRCWLCKTNLHGSQFHCKKGRFYCVDDYQRRFCHTCRHCKKKITVRNVVHAFGGYYHKDCFVCKICSQPFKNGKYFEHNKEPYCEQHHFELTAPRCSAPECKQPVRESELVKLKNKVFHQRCLTCHHCRCSLGADSNIFQKGDRMYCEQDYLTFFARRCTACGDHILKQCVSVNDEYYHPDCLRCAVCDKQLSGYICLEGYLRCQEHDEVQLPPVVCDVCNREVSQNVVLVAGKKVHSECFRCNFCQSHLQKAKAKLFDGHLSCSGCLMAQGQVESLSPISASGDGLLEAHSSAQRMAPGRASPLSVPAPVPVDRPDDTDRPGSSPSRSPRSAASGRRIVRGTVVPAQRTAAVGGFDSLVGSEASGDEDHEELVEEEDEYWDEEGAADQDDLALVDFDEDAGTDLVYEEMPYEDMESYQVQVDRSDGYRSEPIHAQDLPSGGGAGAGSLQVHSDLGVQSGAAATPRSARVPSSRQNPGGNRSQRPGSAPPGERQPLPQPSLGEAFGSHREMKQIEWKRGEMIGKGAFGKVYMAMNKQTGELIAVKQVQISNKEDQELARSIESEIALLKNLRHPNVVNLLGTDRSGDKLNILMEYVPGKSLDTLLEKFGPFSEPVIRKTTQQLLSALAYCHINNVVHRDIKGKNILVDIKGDVKLADFGSAKRFDSAITKDAPSLTYNYTPLWTAPEVLNGVYNSKVDVWSLGCVIIEMTTAKPPWGDMNFENPFRALYHIGNTDSIPTIPSSLSADAQDFLRACLTRDPDQRPSAADLLNHQWVAGIGFQ